MQFSRKYNWRWNTHNTELSLVCDVLGQSSTQLDAIRPTLISSNKHSKQLLGNLPEYSSAPSAQHLGVLTGTTTPPTCPTAQECPQHLKLTDGEFTASSDETQEICVAFQTNPTETRITTMLSQSVACQNLPGARQLCSCTLRSLPEVHAMVRHTFCQGSSHSQQKRKNTQKHGENEILYYSWGERNLYSAVKAKEGNDMNFYKPILRAVTDWSVMVKLSLVPGHIFCLFVLIREVFSCHYPATPFKSSVLWRIKSPWQWYELSYTAPRNPTFQIPGWRRTFCTEMKTFDF